MVVAALDFWSVIPVTKAGGPTPIKEGKRGRGRRKKRGGGGEEKGEKGQIREGGVHVMRGPGQWNKIADNE